MSAGPVSATLAPAAAASRRWAALIIGAGPAGSAAALALAARGGTVLLVNKQCLPRPKVCGGCLNAAGVELLEQLGLGAAPWLRAAPPIERLHLASRGTVARLSLPGGIAISRETLDTGLVAAAIERGVSFLPEVTATVGPCDANGRRVTLSAAEKSVDLRADVVVVADGLAGRSLRNLPEFEPHTATRARVGGSTVLADAGDYAPGIIHMATAAGGYVGLVRLEDDTLNIAAALDVNFVRTSGGPSAAAHAIIADAGLTPPAALLTAAWHGTAALTRRRPRVAAERLFVIGDAAGYIEPFTGEGMAWALASGIAVAPFAAAGTRGWSNALIEGWTQRRRTLLAGRQWRCGVLTSLLRADWFRRALPRTLALCPPLAGPYVRAVNRPLPAVL